MTTIELNPNHTAFILNEHGELIEVYMPENVAENDEVPEKIVKIMEICLHG